MICQWVMRLSPEYNACQTCHAVRPHTPCHAVVCGRGRFMVRRPSTVRGLLKRPRAQRPCARSRCDLARRLADYVSRRSPPCIAPTGACVSPSPSLCLSRTLSTRSVQVAVRPCGETGLPDVISASLSLCAWPPPHAAREGHVPISFPTTSAFPACGTGRRSAMRRTAIAVWRPF